MNPERYQALADRFASLRVAIVGDFCLDRYLEIDPALREISIETGLPVRNVVRVRAQPGGAGTVLNNLEALGIGEIIPVGVSGEDGEGYELFEALRKKSRVSLAHWHRSANWQTFTYTKPLLMHPGKPPEELSRLDKKNWSALPAEVERQIADSVTQLSRAVDAFILLEQVDRPDTGVLTPALLQTIGKMASASIPRLIVADSRQGLKQFPLVTFKMNAAELGRLLSLPCQPDLAGASQQAAQFARQRGQRVIVTLAEQGLLAAEPSGETFHVPSLPLRGEIDIVGAGDAVTANLTAALAAGASLPEAIEIANAAASVVIHQLGTTGTATPEQVRALLTPVST
jgi:rfaE bifunctional protein kinase chain/domain